MSREAALEADSPVLLGKSSAPDEADTPDRSDHDSDAEASASLLLRQNASSDSLSSLDGSGDESSATAAGIVHKPYRKSDVFKEFQTIMVIKVGSHLLADPSSNMDVQIARLAPVVDAVVQLRQAGVHVILVTSGALSMGASRLQLKARPKYLPQQQAACAVGQSRLMRVYDDLFSMAGNHPIAQVLITREDLGQRHRYLNALNTFKELLSYNIIPIVNENDSVGVCGLRFEDNDTLAAGVSNLVEADYLVFLTNVDYLYTKDPRSHLDAQPIATVEDFAALDVEASNIARQYGDKTQWTTGGMATMLNAARLACASGVHCVVLNGLRPYAVGQVARGERVRGTHFAAKKRKRLRGRRRWLAGLVPCGALYLDDGAVRAMQASSSLFPPGIRRLDGSFPAHAPVALLSDASSRVVAHALVNYASAELALIIGRPSRDAHDLLGYLGPDCVCHRDNIVFLDT